MLTATISAVRTLFKNISSTITTSPTPIARFSVTVSVVRRVSSSRL